MKSAMHDSTFVALQYRIYFNLLFLLISPDYFYFDITDILHYLKSRSVRKKREKKKRLSDSETS